MGSGLLNVKTLAADLEARTDPAVVTTRLTDSRPSLESTSLSKMGCDYDAAVEAFREVAARNLGMLRPGRRASLPANARVLPGPVVATRRSSLEGIHHLDGSGYGSSGLSGRGMSTRYLNDALSTRPGSGRPLTPIGSGASPLGKSDRDLLHSIFAHKQEREQEREGAGVTVAMPRWADFAEAYGSGVTDMSPSWSSASSLCDGVSSLDLDASSASLVSTPYADASWPAAWAPMPDGGRSPLALILPEAQHVPQSPPQRPLTPPPLHVEQYPILAMMSRTAAERSGLVRPRVDHGGNGMADAVTPTPPCTPATTGGDGVGYGPSGAELLSPTALRALMSAKWSTPAPPPTPSTPLGSPSGRGRSVWGLTTSPGVPHSVREALMAGTSGAGTGRRLSNPAVLAVPVGVGMGDGTPESPRCRLASPTICHTPSCPNPSLPPQSPRRPGSARASPAADSLGLSRSPRPSQSWPGLAPSLAHDWALPPRSPKRHVKPPSALALEPCGGQAEMHSPRRPCPPPPQDVPSAADGPTLVCLPDLADFIFPPPPSRRAGPMSPSHVAALSVQMRGGDSGCGPVEAARAGVNQAVAVQLVEHGEHTSGTLLQRRRSLDRTLTIDVAPSTVADADDASSTPHPLSAAHGTAVPSPYRDQDLERVPLDRRRSLSRTLSIDVSAREGGADGGAVLCASPHPLSAAGGVVLSPMVPGPLERQRSLARTLSVDVSTPVGVGLDDSVARVVSPHPLSAARGEASSPTETPHVRALVRRGRSLTQSLAIDVASPKDGDGAQDSVMCSSPHPLTAACGQVSTPKERLPLERRRSLLRTLTLAVDATAVITTEMAPLSPNPESAICGDVMASKARPPLEQRRSLGRALSIEIAADTCGVSGDGSDMLLARGVMAADIDARTGSPGGDRRGAVSRLPAVHVRTNEVAPLTTGRDCKDAIASGDDGSRGVLHGGGAAGPETEPCGAAAPTPKSQPLSERRRSLKHSLSVQLTAGTGTGTVVADATHDTMEQSPCVGGDVMRGDDAVEAPVPPTGRPSHLAPTPRRRSYVLGSDDAAVPVPPSPKTPGGRRVGAAVDYDQGSWDSVGRRGPGLGMPPSMRPSASELAGSHSPAHVSPSAQTRHNPSPRGAQWGPAAASPAGRHRAMCEGVDGCGGLEPLVASPSQHRRSSSPPGLFSLPALPPTPKGGAAAAARRRASSPLEGCGPDWLRAPVTPKRDCEWDEVSVSPHGAGGSGSKVASLPPTPKSCRAVSTSPPMGETSITRAALGIGPIDIRPPTPKYSSPRSTRVGQEDFQRREGGGERQSPWALGATGTHRPQSPSWDATDVASRLRRCSWSPAPSDGEVSVPGSPSSASGRPAGIARVSPSASPAAGPCVGTAASLLRTIRRVRSEAEDEHAALDACVLEGLTDDPGTLPSA